MEPDTTSVKNPPQLAYTVRKSFLWDNLILSDTFEHRITYSVVYDVIKYYISSLCMTFFPESTEVIHMRTDH